MYCNELFHIWREKEQQEPSHRIHTIHRWNCPQLFSKYDDTMGEKGTQSFNAGVLPYMEATKLIKIK